MSGKSQNAKPEFPSRAPVAAMLGAALAVVGFIAILSYRAGVREEEANRNIEIYENIRNGSTELLLELTDAETGQRGFLLTGRSQYLEPYHKARAIIPYTVRSLWNAAPNQPEQTERLKALEPLLLAKLAKLQETIQLAQSHRRDEAIAIINGDDGKALMDKIRAQLGAITSSAAKNELRYRSEADATLRWLRIISTAGAALLFVFIALAVRVVFQGIARREELILQTHASNELLSVTLGSIGDGVISTDTTMNVTFINRAAEGLTGWRKSDAMGMALPTVFRIVRESTREPAENPIARALAEGRVVGVENNTSLISRDGTEIFIDDSAAPIRNPEGRTVGAVLVFRDITERRKTERALSESEAFARRVIESSPDWLSIMDLDGRLISMNANGLAQMQIENFSICANSPWVDFWAADAHEKAARALEAAKAGATTTFTGYCPTAKGTPRWWEATVAPIPADDNKPIRVLSVSRDITERARNEASMESARRELESSARELLRSNEDLTRFAYAASHDLRSPLNSIQVFAEFLSERFGDQLGEQGREATGFIIQSAKRMQRLITGLLQFAKAGGGPATAGDRADSEKLLHAVLQDLAMETTAAAAEITHDPLPEVGVAEIHLNQLFQNLIDNAIKYRSASAPRIHVSARKNDGQWTFSVADNGIGIDERHLEYIFQPFERLRVADVPGSGVGLATCRRIVSRYGGAIWAESQPGTGSTFYFTAPEVSEA